MEKGRTLIPECGVSRFLMLLDGPWATLIVRELMHGPHRFSELRQVLPGISAHTLTNRLRRFETYGLVTRTSFPEIPPRVVYELTPVGLELRAVLEAMNRWALAVPEPAFEAAMQDDRPPQRLAANFARGTASAGS